MARPSKAAIVDALLRTHGRTYAAEIGFDPTKNTPSPLFRLLCASLLFSARISIAVSAAKALAAHGWTTAEKLSDSSWEQRTRTLNEAGYARYDERTATMLYPFLDKRARGSAEALGIGDDPRALARLVGKSDFPRLASALVRASDAAARDEILHAAT